MSRDSNPDMVAQVGDWIMGAARRNPEALLLMAAGCALLMRSSGSSSSRAPSGNYRGDSGVGRTVERAKEYASDMKDRVSNTASSYAANIKDRVTDTAGSYAGTVSEFASDTRRNVSETTERFKRQAQSTVQSSVGTILRDQPLVVAIAGLAAGAAVAAAFPSTEIENRTFGGAREALADAASKAGENLMGAAGKAGERLKSAAAERGLSVEGLKNLADDVAETFTSAVKGKPDDVPPAAGTAFGTSGTPRSSDLAGSREPGGWSKS